VTSPGDGRLATVSLRRRVTVATVAVFAVVLVAMAVAVYGSFAVLANRSLAAVLNAQVQLAEQLAAQNTPPAELVDRIETRSVSARLELADGRTLGSLKPRLAGDATVKTRHVRLANSAGPLRGAQLALEVDGRPLAGVRSRLAKVLLLVAVAALAVIAIGVPIVVRLALSPLDAMTRVARGIAGGQRGRRLWAQPGDTELGRTAAAFDNMLDALEGAERRALASEERMRRFVADAAHELRTPITGITAAAEAVLQQPTDIDPQDRQRLLLVLGGEARRAGRLIDDLLDVARIDSGLSLHREPTDLRHLVDAQAERARLTHPGVAVRVDGNPSIATVDPARIGQVVANLLNNACDVTPSSGTVSISVSQSASASVVAVHDGGPGVPVGDRERIFGRLVRLGTGRNGAAQGGGLGLTIARGIARAHGGDVTCQPPPRGTGGAVFVLRLPNAG
jgi:two-component system, OmpR family, sensor kinase